jgi:putative FmdB family regulatory protein
MPIYEFKCTPCNAIFERLLPIDTKNQDCPICGKECSKIISVPAPPVVKDNTPYTENLTSSQKELDKRVGDTIDRDIRPIFEERERQKMEYRGQTKEGRLQRVSGDNGEVMEYVPANDLVVDDRKGKLEEFDTAHTKHVKEREKKGLSQFDDSKKQ